jgi:hypothetical protein
VNLPGSTSRSSKVRHDLDLTGVIKSRLGAPILSNSRFAKKLQRSHTMRPMSAMITTRTCIEDIVLAAFRRRFRVHEMQTRLLTAVAGSR